MALQNVPAPLKQTELQNAVLITTDPVVVKTTSESVSVSVKIGRTGDVPTYIYVLEGEATQKWEGSMAEAVRLLVDKGVDRQKAFYLLDGLRKKQRSS